MKPRSRRPAGAPVGSVVAAAVLGRLPRFQLPDKVSLAFDERCLHLRDDEVMGIVAKELARLIALLELDTEHVVWSGRAALV